MKTILEYVINQKIKTKFEIPYTYKNVNVTLESTFQYASKTAEDDWNGVDKQNQQTTIHIINQFIDDITSNINMKTNKIILSFLYIEDMTDEDTGNIIPSIDFIISTNDNPVGTLCINYTHKQYSIWSQGSYISNKKLYRKFKK